MHLRLMICATLTLARRRVHHDDDNHREQRWFVNDYQRALLKESSPKRTCATARARAPIWRAAITATASWR